MRRPEHSQTARSRISVRYSREWTSRNGEAIYGGVKGNPFSSIFPWGYVSTKGKNLYLYIEDEKAENITLNVGMGNKIKDVSVFGCSEKPEYVSDGSQVKINLLKCPFTVPVYKIEFDLSNLLIGIVLIILGIFVAINSFLVKSHIPSLKLLIILVIVFILKLFCKILLSFIKRIS